VSVATEFIEALCKLRESLRRHIAMLAAMKKQFLEIAGVHGESSDNFLREAAAKMVAKN
jgi:hypothetical protein